MKPFITLSILCQLSWFMGYTQNPSSKIIFEKNLNQWPEQVLYKARIPGGDLFLEKNRLVYNYIESIDWHHEHKNESGGPVKVRYHAIMVDFLGSNPEVKMEGQMQMEGHRNYYLGNDQSRWASNVPLYSHALYKDVYPGIDLSLYESDNNLKYDFIIEPGADPGQIQLQYKGPSSMYLENGHLFINTSLYDLMEQRPYSYQVVNGQKKEVASKYVLKNTLLTFEISGEYDAALPLIIDPTLIASTYSGSYADNWGFTATYDGSDNLYMAGIAVKAGYPYTSGAWDQTYNGGLPATSNQWPFDITISKFNPTATTLLYSTYYGGSNNEQPNSLIVNSKGELYVLGRTNSPNFPKMAGSYGNYNSGYDIIIGRFNNVGYLLGSAIIGGTADDGVNFNINWTGVGSYGATKFSYGDDGRCEVQLDKSENICFVSSTKSANFPVTGGCFDGSLGGIQDAIVIKMDSNLTTLHFSTYLGGSNIDAGFGLKQDVNNDWVIIGGTASSDFPTTAGVLNPNYLGGITDGFVSVLSSNGSSLLRSTFLGTSDYDQSFILDIDANNLIYVYGQTRGSYPVTPNVYSVTDGGMFVHQLNPQLNATGFSTVFGTGSNAVNLSPTVFGLDHCGNLHMGGWARNSVLSANMPNPSSTTGLQVSSNAIQTITDGKDYYFLVLSAGAQNFEYATFFGEGANNSEADHVDGGTNRINRNGRLFHAACASCGGTSGFPTTPGAWSNVNNGGVTPPYTGINCNEAIFCIDMNVYATTNNYWICPGDSIFINGNYYNSSSTIIDTLMIGPGCDSIITSIISVHPLPNVTFLLPVDSICINTGNYLLQTGNPSGGIYSGPGVSGNYFDPLAAGIGTFTISYSYTDGNGCSASASDVVTVDSCLTISTAEWEWMYHAGFYPNPAKNEIIFSASHPGLWVEIADVLGNVVLDKLIIEHQNQRVFVDHLLPGVYLVRLNTPNGKLVKKLIKN